MKAEINRMLTRVLLESLPDMDSITPMDLALAMQNVTNVILELWEGAESGYVIEADGVREVSRCPFCAEACGNSWCPQGEGDAE